MVNGSKKIIPIIPPIISIILLGTIYNFSLFLATSFKIEISSATFPFVTSIFTFVSPSNHFRLMLIYNFD